MIRHLFFAFCLIKLAHGEEPSLADLVPKLSAEEFNTRKAAMEKIQALAKKHPEDTLRKIPHFIKNTKDPEVRLRLREVAFNLKFNTTKSLFGFTFLVDRGTKFEGDVVAGIVLREVVDNYPAKRAGLKNRDIILTLHGKPFPKNLPEEDIREIFASQTHGKKVPLVVQRHGETIDIDVTPMRIEIDQDIKEKLRLDFDDWLREELKK